MRPLLLCVYRLIFRNLLTPLVGLKLQSWKVMACVLLCFMISSCKISDDRDICCQGTSIYVRYVRDISLTDRYTKFIDKTEHFWFDEQGLLLDHTVPVDEEIQHPKIDFSHGKYTLMVLGNRTEKTNLQYQVGTTHLRDITMQLNSAKQNNFYSNSDKLYWGLLPFEVYRTKKKDYICDISNIHASLKITVKWKNNLPTESGLYSLRLLHLPSTYHTELHEKEPKIVVNPFSISGEPEGVSTEKQVVHSFPTIVPPSSATPAVSQELLVPMSSAKLTGEFISFRYDDDFLPILDVWKGNRSLLPLDDSGNNKVIDLTKVFREYDWVPSEMYEQALSLIIEIDPITGSVTVQPEGGLNVNDWEDGGNINFK